MAAIGPPPGPYRGIRPFRYADRDNFFGRSAEVEHLLAMLLTYRIVVLYGESGAGKSSVLNAGLVPALLKERFRPERLRIGPEPSRPVLVERIAADTAETRFLPSIFAATQEHDGHKQALDIEELVRATREHSDARPVLIVDQFEELFTRFSGAGSPAGPSIQQQVLGTLLGLAQVHDLAVKLLIVIREDYLAKLEPSARTVPPLSFNRVQPARAYLSVRANGHPPAL